VFGTVGSRAKPRNEEGLDDGGDEDSFEGAGVKDKKALRTGL